jgi:hypothetical protein
MLKEQRDDSSVTPHAVASNANSEHALVREFSFLMMIPPYKQPLFGNIFFKLRVVTVLD